MRLQKLAMALLCSASIAAPAFAQPATAPMARPGSPAVPMTTTVPATRPATPTPMTPMTPPASGSRTTPTALNATAAPTNINTASAAELDKLPQIGKARAAKIISNRPYRTPDELVSKKAISQGVFNKIKDRITTG